MEFQFIHRDTYPEADGEFPNITTNSKCVTYNDGAATWRVVLDEFISFLGSVYGYDIRDMVKYKSIFDKMEDLYEEYPDLNESNED